MCVYVRMYCVCVYVCVCVCVCVGLAPGLRASSTAATSFDSLDDNYMADRNDFTDNDDKRAFTYMVLGSAKFIYASTVRLALIKGVATLSASADVLAMASLEVDLTNIGDGECSTVKWRGKPVFIKKRTDDEISMVADNDVSSLRDPQLDSERVTDPKWLIVLGVCTHLGCVPIANAGEYKGEGFVWGVCVSWLERGEDGPELGEACPLSAVRCPLWAVEAPLEGPLRLLLNHLPVCFPGWFCPCHGSHYDLSGRIRKGPAPLNLEVPPYKFIEDGEKVILG